MNPCYPIIGSIQLLTSMLEGNVENGEKESGVWVPVTIKLFGFHLLLELGIKNPWLSWCNKQHGWLQRILCPYQLPEDNKVHILDRDDRCFERGVKKSYVSMEKPFLNRGSGLRHLVSTNYNAVLSSIPRKFQSKSHVSSKNHGLSTCPTTTVPQ